MVKNVSVPELRSALESSLDAAYIDVRETAEYNLAHIGGTVSLPRRQIEFRINDLVPYSGTSVVVCDDDGRRAGFAAGTLEGLGYTDLRVLTGGLNRWVTDGGITERGVNVPSKDFGEKVLVTQDVPEIDPDELNEWLKRGDKLILLDSRTPEEHQRACIPGSRSMPGAELGLRAWELIEDSDVPVVVHCAGRTRSILGAGTLKRMGIKNVYALKNGTMGWELAGLQVETGSTRLELPAPTEANKRVAEEIARRVAIEEGVRFIEPAQVDDLDARSTRENVYFIDVRTRKEHVDGHIPGFRWVPGGQAVQGWDNYIAVKGGQVVFACDALTRASMTASWFRQMGFPNVFVVDGGTTAWSASGRGLVSGMTDSRSLVSGSEKTLSVSDLAQKLSTEHAPVLIHVGTSDEFSDGHVPGSTWIPRGWLELRIEALTKPSNSVVVTCADGVNSRLGASTLRLMGYADVAALEGGLKAWREDGQSFEKGLTGVLTPPDDVMPLMGVISPPDSRLPVHRSYADMVNYLRWEEELGAKYKR